MKPFDLQEFKTELETAIEAGEKVHPYPPIYLLGLAWQAEAAEAKRAEIEPALTASRWLYRSLKGLLESSASLDPELVRKARAELTAAQPLLWPPAKETV